MAKNNEKIWRILRIILLVSGILVSIAIAYGALNNQVEDNTQTIEKHEIKLEAHDKDIVELRTDVKYIRRGIDEIKAKLK